MRRSLLAVLLFALTAAAAPAATKPSAFARTISCRAADVAVTFDGKGAVIWQGKTTLAQATRLRRSASSHCDRIGRLTVFRGLLDKEPDGRRVSLSCHTDSYAKIVVEPVRSGSGRIIGSRLALFGPGNTIAEAVISSRTTWFSWASSFCHKT